ncbi:FAD-dependent oxidoreductase [Streptomyces lydicamycinicus]|uniref:FAD-dependent oxidoreductase n=1 Tax=Streptomyces lydicamycinicus TaxID=1546107 RepID=UPI003C2B94B0
MQLREQGEHQPAQRGEGRLLRAALPEAGLPLPAPGRSPSAARSPPRRSSSTMGGGPVGLTLACEVALAEISVVVLERLTEVDTTIKAGAINSPSSEAFYRRGMLPGLVEAQRAALEKPARVGPGVDPGQVALMRPEPHAPALRGVLAEPTGTVTPSPSSPRRSPVSGSVTTCPATIR